MLWFERAVPSDDEIAAILAALEVRRRTHRDDEIPPWRLAMRESILTCFERS